MEVNWIAEYRLMYLKQLKLVTKAARPSLQLKKHALLERNPSCKRENEHWKAR